MSGRPWRSVMMAAVTCAMMGNARMMSAKEYNAAVARPEGLPYGFWRRGAFGRARIPLRLLLLLLPALALNRDPRSERATTASAP